MSKSLNQTDPFFSKYVKNSLDIFAEDPSFKDDFNYILVGDACNLTQMLCDPWQVYYCFNNFTFDILSLGLVNGMTFWQRNAFEALNHLRNKQLQNINKTEYFRQEVFQDIDDSIIYLYQLWLLTQDRMYQGLNNIVENYLFLLDLLNTSCTLLLFLMMVWWMLRFRREQQMIADLHGIVLQLP